MQKQDPMEVQVDPMPGGSARPASIPITPVSLPTPSPLRAAPGALAARKAAESCKPPALVLLQHLQHLNHPRARLSLTEGQRASGTMGVTSPARSAKNRSLTLLSTAHT